jgi:type VI secretion system secreted protein VgrG
MSQPQETNLPPVEYAFRVSGVTGSPWLVRDVDIQEQLSGEFVAEIGLDNDDRFADPGALLGASATVTLWRPVSDLPARHFSGVVRAMHEPWSANPSGRRRCRVVLEPAVVRLREERLTRKFQEATVPDVLRQVLTAFFRDLGGDPDADLRFDLRREAEPPSSSRTYAARDLCVQYGETTLDFLRRLMSEEGMSYFFEQEQAGERLVVVDENAAFPRATGAYLLRPPDGHVTNREAVHSFAVSKGPSAARAEVRALNLTQHRVAMGSYARDGAGGGDLYLTGSGVTLFGYQQDAYRRDDAGVQARLAVERSAALEVTGAGTGDVIAFRPGLVVTLEPEESMMLPHAGGKFLLAGVRHRGASGAKDGVAVYGNQFTCIPAEIPFRPALLAKPTAVGDWGTVVSASDDDPIDADVHGRVRLRFGYDRDETVPAERRSPWIPVAQPWAGSGYGVQIIPRAGMLVRIGYLFGDPDRPYVAGCLPTGRNVLPSPPPGEKTRLTIRTNSLREGGNDLVHFNEITLDDDAGREEVFIRAGRDYRRKVLNDERVEVDHHQKVEVRGGRTKTIHEDETILVEQRRTATVGGDDQRHVRGNDRLTVERDQSIEVRGSRSTTIGGLDSGVFLGGRDESVDGTDLLHVSRMLSVTGDQALRAVQGPTELLFKDGDATLKAGGAIRLAAKGARLTLDGEGRAVLECDQKLSLLCGEASVVLAPDKIVIAAPEVDLTGANGAVKLDRGGAATSGLTVSSRATLGNEITGAFVKAN